MVEYLITFAVLLFIYACGHYAILDFWQPRSSPKEPPDFEGKSIDASELVERVHVVRKEMMANKPTPQTNSFKRALLVENSRAQVTKLGFFHSRPTVPLPDEADEDLHLFLV